MDEDVVVAKEGVLSTHGGPINQGRLHHTDVTRQIEVLPLDVKLTPTSQQAEAVGGQSRGIVPSRDHQQGLLLVHLVCLLVLPNVTITAVAVVQGLYRPADGLDRKDHPVDLHHHLERYLGEIGRDLTLVVIDHDPMHILNTLAHVHPEDAGGIPRHRHQATRLHLHQDIGRGGERLHRVKDRGRFQGPSMAGEAGEAETLDDHPHLIHRMIEELQGLMLSRTALSETTVV